MSFITTNWKRFLGIQSNGNNGKFVEVWMDGAKGSGANAQEYNFQKMV